MGKLNGRKYYFNNRSSIYSLIYKVSDANQYKYNKFNIVKKQTIYIAHPLPQIQNIDDCDGIFFRWIFSARYVVIKYISSPENHEIQQIYLIYYQKCTCKYTDIARILNKHVEFQYFMRTIFAPVHGYRRRRIFPSTIVLLSLVCMLILARRIE